MKMMLVEEKDALKERLKQIFGYSQFRGNQETIIRNLLDGKNTFVIMPTGAGKSLCYQLPAMVREGLAIVISPLIALMKNQVDQMNAYGVNARFLNSTLSKGEITRLKKDCMNGVVKLLYVAPESLNKEETIEFLKKVNVSFVAIDEAHCISEWGHDFRPDYLTIPASRHRSVHRTRTTTSGPSSSPVPGAASAPAPIFRPAPTPSTAISGAGR